jgi:ribosome-binding factor A
MGAKTDEARGGRAPSQRQLRVGEEIRHALADILRRGELRDPLLQDVNVTVTEVRVSPDLKNATAFVLSLGASGDAKKNAELVAALTRASAFLRGQLAREVRLPHVPRLSFQVDASFDYAANIDRLLHRSEVARDLGPAPETDAGAPDPDDAE